MGDFASTPCEVCGKPRENHTHDPRNPRDPASSWDGADRFEGFIANPFGVQLTATKPRPVTRCTSCGLDWYLHPDESTYEDCVKLLREELESSHDEVDTLRRQVDDLRERLNTVTYQRDRLHSREKWKFDVSGALQEQMEENLLRGAYHLVDEDSPDG